MGMRGMCLQPDKVQNVIKTHYRKKYQETGLMYLANNIIV